MEFATTFLSAADALISSQAAGERKINALTQTLDQLNQQKAAIDKIKTLAPAAAGLSSAAAPIGAAAAGQPNAADKAKSSLTQATQAAKALGVNVTQLADEEKRLEQTIQRTNQSLLHRKAITANKLAWSDTKAGITTLAAPMAAMAAPVMLAADFETTMLDVIPALNLDPSGTAVNTVEKDILSMSSKIPMAVNGIAAIMTAAGRFNLTGDRTELNRFTEDAATMGLVFKMSGAQSGTMMAAWRSKMKLNQDQAVGIADAVTHLSGNMGVQASNLGAVLEMQGAVAVSAGLTETQAASLSAALLSGGAAPKAAAQGLAALTHTLASGARATDAQKAAFNT